MCLPREKRAQTVHFTQILSKPNFSKADKEAGPGAKNKVLKYWLGVWFLI
jgi:hypothetical protein